MVDYNPLGSGVSNLRDYLHCNVDSSGSRNYGNYDLNENENPDFFRRYGGGELQGLEVDVQQVLAAQDSFVRCNRIIQNDDMQEEITGNELQQDCQIATIVDEPYVGMEFNSHDEAYQFYNTYAKCVGFSTRIGGTHKSRVDDTIISRVYYCSKEGFRRRPNNEEPTRVRAITREGCKARLVIKKRNDKWHVSAFEENHNHDLAPQSKVHLLRSHKKTSSSQGIMCNPFASPRSNTINGLGLNVFGQSPKGAQNVLQGKLGALGIDGPALVSYFQSIQSKNPMFFYSIQVDLDYSLSNIFWVDGRSRSSYKYFYDVISLDLTYKKKRHCMPFVSITGVNHHRESISFGCSLISEESESAFVWLFQTWLQAMNYQHPTLIITDHDPVIRAAVAKVFPGARHRFCKWRILERVPERLEHVMLIHKEVMKEIEDIVNFNDTIDGFERSWEAFLQKYNLQEDDWLQSLYVDRYCWVPAYLKGTFFAGMSGLERNECVKSLFHSHILTKTTLNAFIRQYEKALEDQYEKEVKEEFLSVNSNLPLRTPIPMEQQASNVYTRKVFLLFQEEIVQSLALVAKIVGGDGSIFSTYVVKKYGTNDEGHNIIFNNTTKEGDCSCRKFDYEGIICRHILAVFQKLDIFELAPCYILRRWTKYAKKEIEQEECLIGCLSEGLDNMTFRYNSLCQEAMKCVEYGASSIESYHLMKNTLKDLFEKLHLDTHKISTELPSNVAMQIETRNDPYDNMTIQDSLVARTNENSPLASRKKCFAKASKRMKKIGHTDGNASQDFTSV